MKRILISGILIGLFIGIGTIAAIYYANGYRFTLNPNGNGKIIEGTGLLVATSKPDGARVLVNNRLTTATNNTINLHPGEYEVEIQKDGYLPWKKKISIKKSLVSEANALLFPAAPKLEAITTTGVSNVIMDSNQTLIAYTISASTDAKSGIYVLNMNSRPLIFLGATGTQIISDAVDKFSQAELSFSPDGKQLLAKLPNAIYLLNTDSRNDNPQDVTNTLFLVERDWDQQGLEKEKKLLDSFSKNLKSISSTYFSNMNPSPEGDRILYTASVSGTLSPVLKAPVPSVNSTPDQRKIEKGNVYVYDIKEDKNYLLDKNSKNEELRQYFWHPDSRHLIFVQGDKINIVEYDGQNLTGFYSGPFLDGLVFPWTDGSSLAVVARLSSTVPHNLYRISLQ